MYRLAIGDTLNIKWKSRVGNMEKYYPDTIYCTLYEDLKQKDGSDSYYYRLAEPFEFKLIDDIISVRDFSIEDLRKEIKNRFSYMIYFSTYDFKLIDTGFTYTRYVKYLGDDIIVSDENDYTDKEVYTFEFKWIKEVNLYMNELE